MEKSLQKVHVPPPSCQCQCPFAIIASHFCSPHGALLHCYTVMGTAGCCMTVASLLDPNPTIRSLFWQWKGKGLFKGLLCLNFRWRLQVGAMDSYVWHKIFNSCGGGIGLFYMLCSDIKFSRYQLDSYPRVTKKGVFHSPSWHRMGAKPWFHGIAGQCHEGRSL